jgi:outer membrane PBP1 activator LpoA protein
VWVQARILTGDVGRNPMKGVSRKKIGELEAELALAQDHEREIQSSLSSLNAQHLKELAEHSKEHQVRHRALFGLCQSHISLISGFCQFYLVSVLYQFKSGSYQSYTK